MAASQAQRVAIALALEQIIGKLGQADVRSAEGKRVAEIVRELGSEGKF